MLDAEIYGKVAVLMGGDSSEREISLRSGDAVLNSLLRSNVNACAFDPSKQSLSDLITQKIDRVFIALHGRGGEDGGLQAVLDYFNIPFTGSGSLACGIAMNKVLCKRIWDSAGLVTAKYDVITNKNFKNIDLKSMLNGLGGCVFVKPASEGSSIGIHKVTDFKSFDSALADAFTYDDCILVESELLGDEYTVSFVGDSMLPSIKLKSSNEFYDFDAKYNSNNTSYLCPSGLSRDQEAEIQNISFKAIEALGMSGWGRVDLMQDSAGVFNLLEVNASPGMTEKSLVPMAANEVGINFDDLVLRVLDQTLRER